MQKKVARSNVFEVKVNNMAGRKSYEGISSFKVDFGPLLGGGRTRTTVDSDKFQFVKHIESECERNSIDLVK